MMLRTFAVIGLSTLTASATLASVEDARHFGPSPALDAKAFQFHELPELDLSRRVVRVARDEPMQARVYPKTPSDQLHLPINKEGTEFVGTGRILIKFRNDVRARAELFPSRTLFSTAGRDLTVVTDLLEAFDASIHQLIQKNPQELEKLRRVVLERSNRVQPDFAAIMVVGFPNGVDSDDLLALGRGLNDLDLTEYVVFETPILPASPMGGGAPDPISPDTNPATSTPDFTSAPWLRAAIPANIPSPIPPTEAFDYPPYTNQNLALQQYQIGNGTIDPLSPAIIPTDDDPTTWFLGSQFRGATGYDLPGMIRLAGQTWRRYGTPPVGPDGSIRNQAPPSDWEPGDPCPLPDQPFYVDGCPPFEQPRNPGFLGTLPSPTRVWLYGAEFEIVDIEAYNQPGGVTYGDRTYGEGFIPPPAGSPDNAWVPNPDCPDCIPGYPIIPRLESGDIPLKNASNPFPEFATDLLNLQIYENIILCPTGNRTEIGVIDIAAFEFHEEWLYDRFGRSMWDEDAGSYVEEAVVSFEEGQTMVLLEDLENEFTRSNASHGTAVAGVLVAGNNNFGLTGMTWASKVRFFPSLSLEEGARLSSAITSAIIELEPGSILCCPIQTTQGEAGTAPEIGAFTLPGDGLFPGLGPAGQIAGLPPVDTPAGGYIPLFPDPYPGNPVNASSADNAQHLSSNTVYSSLLNAARDAGLVVVQAAGNGGATLANDPGGEGAEGAGIICTAVTPSGRVNQIDPALCAALYVPDPECDPMYVFPWPLDGSQPCSYYGLTQQGTCGEECPYPAGVWSAWPAFGQTRWPGSNFFPADGEEDSNVLGRTVSGWGMGVPSLGYGDFYRNQIPSIGLPPATDPLSRDFLRSYTGPRPDAPTYNPAGSGDVDDAYVFGNEGGPGGVPLNHNGLLFQGTSLAATQTAGLACWLQGFAQMFYGTQLSDTQILSAMDVNGFVNEDELQPNACDNDPTGFAGNPATGSNSLAGGTAALVPPVPSGPAAVINVLTQIGQTFNGDVLVYYGERIRGSKFSLSQAGDGNALQIRSEPANLGQTNEGITYLVTGYTTDLGLLLQSPAEPSEIITMSVSTVRRVTLIPAAFEVAYVRNVTNNRYVPLGVGLLANDYGDPQVYQFGAPGTPRIEDCINDEKIVDVRFYSLSFGFVGSPPYTILYDEISLEINDANGPNDP